MVEARPSVNLVSLTIEEVLSMWSSPLRALTSPQSTEGSIAGLHFIEFLPAPGHDLVFTATFFFSLLSANEAAYNTLK